MRERLHVPENLAIYVPQAAMRATQDMDEDRRALRETPIVPGHERVVYASLPAHEEDARRLKHGIPYHPEVIARCRGLCAELGLPERFS